LIKHDSAAQGVSEDLNGMVQPMRKVPAPFESLETEAKAPQSNDDFVGWYEAVWMRALRYHIRKEGDKFVAEGQIVGRPERNEPAFELMPLTDSLGFKMGSRGKTSFVYNEKLKRYEVGGAGSPVSIPLRRMETGPSKDLPRYPDVAGLGIPSWH
jgi:hypothetical protein